MTLTSWFPDFSLKKSVLEVVEVFASTLRVSVFPLLVRCPQLLVLTDIDHVERDETVIVSVPPYELKLNSFFETEKSVLVKLLLVLLFEFELELLRLGEATGCPPLLQTAKSSFAFALFGSSFKTPLR